VAAACSYDRAKALLLTQTTSHPTKQGQEMQPKDLTPENVNEYYTKLRSSTVAVRQPPKDAPKRWSADEFQVASGYAIRVAKSTTLPEFDHFLRTGELTVPVKMTPSEMEVLMGGSPATTWIGVGALFLTLAATACCDA
jgi:hypothetical protein